ncbi:MAG: hypothetical protein PHR55_03205 [Bacilli bacterium]|nr:hypothetical protein [Bacilli bacterium]
MKKIILFIIAIIIFTGCSISKIDLNKDTIIENIFKNNNNLVNTVSPGYKYYMPNGVVLVGRDEYNETLYSKGDFYYLYVDVVSYYNKTKLEYEENKEIYYSKKLDYKDKQGYIEISKLNDSYFIQIMYNYAKIEVYVKENNIEKALLDSGYILSSLKFNNILAEEKLGNTYDSKNEEKLNIFVPKREEGTFLDSLEDSEENTEEETEDNNESIEEEAEDNNENIEEEVDDDGKED